LTKQSPSLIPLLLIQSSTWGVMLIYSLLDRVSNQSSSLKDFIFKVLLSRFVGGYRWCELPLRAYLEPVDMNPLRHETRVQSIVMS